MHLCTVKLSEKQIAAARVLLRKLVHVLHEAIVAHAQPPLVLAAGIPDDGERHDGERFDQL